jgi:hypothetical protein
MIRDFLSLNPDLGSVFYFFLNPNQCLDVDAGIGLEEAQRHPLEQEVQVGHQRLRIRLCKGDEQVQGPQVLLEVRVEHHAHQGLVEVRPQHLKKGLITL